MQIEFTWLKWAIMFTRQNTPGGQDRWLTIGPVHFRWTKRTDRDRLRNLVHGLSEHDSDCAIHNDAGCDCGANEFARKFSTI